MTRRLIFAAVSTLIATGALSAVAAPAHAAGSEGTYCVVTSPDPNGRRIRDICLTV